MEIDIRLESERAGCVFEILLACIKEPCTLYIYIYIYNKTKQYRPAISISTYDNVLSAVCSVAQQQQSSRIIFSKLPMQRQQNTDPSQAAVPASAASFSESEVVAVDARRSSSLLNTAAIITVRLHPFKMNGFLDVMQSPKE